jgi:hypothetical protein
MTWIAPKTFVKGIVIPEEVRAMLTQTDKLGIRVSANVGYWSINGVEKFKSWAHPGMEAPPDFEAGPL